MRVANPAITTMSSRAFEETMNQSISGFRVRDNPGGSDMRGIFSTQEVCGFITAHVACSVLGVRRDEKSIKRSDPAYYLLVHQDEGHALMRQRTSTHRLRSGDIMLLDTTQPLDFTFFGAYQRQVVVHIPRDELHERVGTGGQIDLYLPASDNLASAIRAVLAEGLVWADSGDRPQLRECLLTLTTSAIIASKSDGEADAESVAIADADADDVLQQMLAFLDAHYTQPNLALADIAAAVGLSARQVQRAMEPLGASPSQYLLGKRLEHATEMLVGSLEVEHPTIASIAFESGFNDVSHFNRKFRETFGMSPSEWRRMQAPPA